MLHRKKIGKPYYRFCQKKKGNTTLNIGAGNEPLQILGSCAACASSAAGCGTPRRSPAPSPGSTAPAATPWTPPSRDRRGGAGAASRPDSLAAWEEVGREGRRVGRRREKKKKGAFKIGDRREWRGRGPR